MAGIDKTYISSYENYKKVIDWCKDKSFKLKNGSIINPSDFIYYPDITIEEWNKWKEEYNQNYQNSEFEVVLWNTPIYLDVWLIRNCPFDFIQERLKEQYGGDWSKTAFTNYNESTLYEQIKNGTSIYDTYERNGLGWNAKLKFHTVSGIDIRDKNCSYWIDVNPYWIGNKRTKFEESYCYNEDTDNWYLSVEAMPWTSSNLFIKGWLSKKRIVRMIKKWNLPKGTIVKFEQIYQGKNGRYLAKEFFVSVS